MCTSVLQIVFTVVLVIGTAATLVSMFTPGWRSTKFSINNVTNAVVNPPKSAGGIFQFLCSDANTGTTSNTNTVQANATSGAGTCAAYWQVRNPLYSQKFSNDLSKSIEYPLIECRAL
jgi:protein-S-isoprenylcysteine O-methyltransferase Ste14